MYHQQRKLPLIVKKSNELVRTQLSVENNALANKIFVTLIRNLEENRFPGVSFPAIQLLGGETKPNGDDYKRLKTAADVLMKARLDSLCYDRDGKEIGFRLYNLFASCVYENGIVTAEFSASLKPHLLGLKKYFTPLNYFDLIELSSFYSQRLYELIKSWENPDGFCEVKLDALYDLISFPVTMRKNFKEVRIRALEQAEKEINKKTELKFKWEPIKEGLKVVAIRFIIGEQGETTKRKMAAKEEDKKRKQSHLESAERKPYLNAASTCRREHGIEPGATCSMMKPRTKKCQMCRKAAEVKNPNPTLF